MEVTYLKYEVVIILFINTFNASVTPPAACKIYCGGELLEVVQTSNMYQDSRTFVNMKLKFPVDFVLWRYKNLKKNIKGPPSKWVLKRFIRRHFIGTGLELYGIRPHDWKEDPKVLERIPDNRLKDWAKKLNSFWLRLCRKVHVDVRDHPEQYSLVYLPHLIVIPGERFTEYRYWDMYWIVLGLLRSEMYNTAKGILENLILLVESYGIVPTGGRIYFLTRSEPPLLIPMTKLYYNFTQDRQFIESHINTLESEFQFWRENRCVEIPWENVTLKLAHYDASVAKPRPEAYREDVAIANFSSKARRRQIFLDLKAGSQTGWDFSSRWLIHKGSRSKSLSHIKTREIIPVDLNAILCWNARILSEFYELINEEEKAEEYTQIASDWERSLTALLWSENDGSWYDYDKLNKKKRKYFYASNLSPLWTKCYDRKKTDHIARRVVNYLSASHLLQYGGGIPVSTYQTNHHYDFPTALPPLQHMIIMGLKSTGNWQAKELAFKLAFNWIRSNFKGFLVSGLMFDQYHCEVPGAYGGKSEYVAQIGYGWTNGVILDLLYTYGDVIHSHGIEAAACRIYNGRSSGYIIFVTRFSSYITSYLLFDIYTWRPIYSFLH